MTETKVVSDQAGQPRSFVCTLYEGHYHLGVGALLNSLYRSGFRGEALIGFRGKLPSWAGAGATVGIRFELPSAPGLGLRFVKIQDRMHFTNYKPTFLLRGFEEFCPGAEMGFYFDPDILVRCGWDFFEKWVEVGVALCEDMFPRMPPTHPHRAEWARHAASAGCQARRQLEGYLNGGLVGLQREHKGFLEIWKKLLDALGPEALTRYKFGGRDHFLSSMDQDMLNATAMTSVEPISVIGPDAMGFFPGANSLMLHAAGSPKPWRKRMLWRTLTLGRRPTMADREFYVHTQHPIRLFSKPAFFFRKLDLRLGCAIGRYLG
jgi:hypothetical protein